MFAVDIVIMAPVTRSSVHGRPPALVPPPPPMQVRRRITISQMFTDRDHQQNTNEDSDMTDDEPSIQDGEDGYREGWFYLCPA